MSWSPIKVFAGPRGSGRTSALIQWAREDPHNRRVVVCDKIREAYVERKAPDVRVWTVAHVNQRSWKSWVTLGVDDYDELMIKETGITNGFGHQIRAVVIQSDEYINVPYVPLQPIVIPREQIRTELNAMLFRWSALWP